MKTLIFAIILLNLFSNLTTAQDSISKGVYRISGTMGFSISGEEESYYKNSEKSFQLSGSLAYLITNQLEIGGAIGFNYYEHTYEYKYDFSPMKHTEYFSGIDIGPSLRYYFTTKGIIPFVEASASYSAAGNQGSSNKVEISSYSFSAGIDYFLARSLALEPYISYTKLFHKDDSRYVLFIGVGLNHFIF